MIVASGFRPAWWLKNPHLQTIYPALLRRVPPSLAAETLATEDDDFIDLLWLRSDPTRPVVIILHGLEGTLHSHYATGLLEQLRRLDYQAVFMYFRGCSGRHNRRDRNYHSGETGDLRQVLRHVRRGLPDAPLFAVGYSLGGNVLLKHLGETGGGGLVEAAVAVSVPFDLAQGAAYLDQGFSRFYQYHLISKLVRKMRSKYAGRAAPFDLQSLSRRWNFTRFDDHVTAPLHGFVDAGEYYRRCSARPFLGAIRVPTLIIHARDDPFVPPQAIPLARELAPQTTLELAERGGHVGFVSGGAPFRPEHWLERRIADFLQSAAATEYDRRRARRLQPKARRA